MIAEIELYNFQKHSHLTIKLVNGVNVIVGDTESGKSCLMRAITWLFCPNELKGDIIRKEGTKKTYVKAVLDNGIEIKRIRTNSINRYEVKKGEEIKQYDAVGKGNFPEDIEAILKIKPIEIDKERLIINISEQISLPFLLDKSGSFRMKLFNQMTNSDIIDKVLQDYNKEVLNLNKELKIEAEGTKEREDSLKNLEEIIKEKQKKYNNLIIVYNELKEKLELYKTLKTTYNKLLEIEKERKLTEEKLDKIKIIDIEVYKNIEQVEEKHRTLKLYYDKLTELNESVNKIQLKLDSLKLPEIDLEKMKSLSNSYTDITTLNDRLKKISENRKELISKIKNLEEKIDQNQIEYRKLLKEAKICPTCKTNLTEEQIKGINL